MKPIAVLIKQATDAAYAQGYACARDEVSDEYTACKLRSKYEEEIKERMVRAKELLTDSDTPRDIRCGSCGKAYLGNDPCREPHSDAVRAGMKDGGYGHGGYGHIDGCPHAVSNSVEPSVVCSCNTLARRKESVTRMGHDPACAIEQFFASDAGEPGSRGIQTPACTCGYGSP